MGTCPFSCKIISKTRMHSSRMRTGRSLTVFRGLLVLGGVYLPEWGVPARGVYLPGRGCTCQRGVGCTCQGGVPAWGVYLPRGVPGRGCTCWGGTCQRGHRVPARGGCTCPGGVPAQEGYLAKKKRGGRCTCWGGGCTCWGVYLPGGCTCPVGYLAGGCTCWGVCTCWGGVPARRVYLPEGGVPARGVPSRVVCLPGGVHARGGCTCLGGCTWSGTPPC